MTLPSEAGAAGWATTPAAPAAPAAPESRAPAVGEEQSGRYRRIFEASDLAIAICRPDGALDEVNPAFERLLAYPRSELLALSWQQITHPDDVAGYQGVLADLLAGRRERYRLESRYLTRGGRPVWARVTVSLLPTGEGQPAVVTLIEDISADRAGRQRLETSAAELAEANRALAEANERLAAATAERTRFLAMAAHELRTPVTALSGLAQTLSRGWDRLAEDERLELAGRITGRTDLLARLVGDLLTVSAAGASRLHVIPRRLQLSPLIAELAREYGGGLPRTAGDDPVGSTGQPTAPSTELSLRCPPGVHVLADPDRVRQMLTNYLANAHRYGRPPVGLVVDDEAGRQVVVRVCDSGAGVPADRRERLFVPFGADGERRHRDSTGLGLSIVRALAEAQGGQAWYEPGPRPCFAFSLPRA